MTIHTNFKAIPAIREIRTASELSYDRFTQLIKEAAPDFVNAGLSANDAFHVLEQTLGERGRPPVEIGKRRDEAFGLVRDAMEEKQSPNLRRALALADAGFEVFPCREREQINPETGEVYKVKTPYTAHGFKDASRDPGRLREWWRSWPEALVGLPTGKRNGLAVLDLDRKDGKDGIATLGAIGADAPSPLTLPTPSGGEHRYFRIPEALGKVSSGADLFKTLAGQSKTGVDIRGDGGYVIVWDDIGIEALANLPEWPAEIEAVRQRDETERQARQEYPPQNQRCDGAADLGRIRDALSHIPADDHDTWVAIGMALKAELDDAGESLFDEWSRTAPDKYDTRDQRRRWKSFRGRGVTIASLFWHARQNGWRPSSAPNASAPHSTSGAEGSGAKAASTEKIEAYRWPEPMPLTNEEANDPYPLHALPDGIRDAVKEVHDYAQTPLAMVAMSALAALSAAGQGLVDVRRDAMLRGAVSLYSLLIGESGERKTTADKFFTKALHDFEKRKAEEMEPEIKAARARHVAWEAKKRGKEEAIKNETRKGRDTTALENDLEVIAKAEPSIPRLPVLIRQDDTVEELAFALARKWPSAAIISSEAGLVLGGHAMSKENALKGLAQKNVFWDGGSVHVGRRTSESFTVRGARLSIYLQAQAAAVRSFTKQSGDLARGIGFWARCLMAWPKSTQGHRPYKEPRSHAPALDKFSRRIGVLLEEPLPMDEAGTLTPAVLEFSAEGKRLWIELHDGIEAELLPGGDCETIRDVASKAAENIARLAALFHVFGHGSQGEIGADTVRRAGEVVLWHLVEARRFFDGVAMSQERLDAIALDEWLRSKGGASSRDITHFGPNALRDGGWEKALERIEASGRARRIATGARGFKVEVNPALMGGRDVS